MLRILLLGTPAVYLDGNLLRVKRRTQRALLFYLACQPDLSGRSDLMLLFWPDNNEQDARRHLREALSKLRAQLGDDSYWITDQDRIGLNPETVMVDARKFEEQAGQLWHSVQQNPVRNPLPEAIFQQVLSAVTMWRSPRFLSGTSLPSTAEFDRWLASKTQQLEWGRQHLLEHLSYHAAASGDLETAIHWMGLALEHDELNEGLHRQVLQWYDDLGRYREAQNYCARLKDLFLRETGGGLSQGLSQLCDEIAQKGVAPLVVKTGWPVSLRIQVPFVGRADAMRELKLAYQSGRSVIIFGESGAGKTRMVYEFYRSSDPQPRLLLAQGRSAEVGLPFQPLIELLRQYVSQEEWLRLDPVWVAPLSYLLPELLILRPEIQVSGQQEVDEARALIFEALRQLLLMLSNSNRLLLFLDDAQWCDEASLSALAYLQERKVFLNRGLLVMATRLEEANPYLDSFLARAHIQPLLVRLNLPQLSPEEISELTRFVFGQEPPAALSERLARDTGGNPLFLIETLRAWLERAPQPNLLDGAAGLPMGNSIRTLLRERMLNFSEVSRDVLATAAVIGHEFSLDVLEAAAGLEPKALVQAIEELERGRMIEPDKRSAPSVAYTFIHNTFREALLLELSPARKRLLHLQVAQALQKLARGQVEQAAAVLAGHYEAAGQGQHAFSYWLQAAGYARALFSSAEAYAAYRHAEHICQASGEQILAQEIYNLYASWGEMAFELTDSETMKRVYTALLRRGEQQHSAWLVGCALSGLANMEGMLDRPKQALALVEQAIPYLEEAGDRTELIIAYKRLATFLGPLNRYLEAVQVCQKAIELGQGSSDERIRSALANVESWQAFLQNLTGWPKQAEQMARHALSEWRLLMKPERGAQAYGSLALAQYFKGEHEAARESSRLGLEIAKRVSNGRQIAMLSLVAAHIELAQGYLDECWTYLETSREFSERYHFGSLMVEQETLRGDLYGLTYHPQESLACLRRAAAERGGSYMQMNAAFRLGLALVMTGQDPQEGQELLERAVTFASRVGLGVIQLPAELNMAYLHALRSSREEGMARIQEIMQETGRRGLAMLTVMGELALGGFCLEQDRLEEAWQHTQTATQAARSMHSLFVEIRALQQGRQVAERAGRESADQLSRIQELLQEMGEHARLPAVCPLFENYRRNILEK